MGQKCVKISDKRADNGVKMSENEHPPACLDGSAMVPEVEPIDQHLAPRGADVLLTLVELRSISFDAFGQPILFGIWFSNVFQKRKSRGI
jgi:hypothetical protein